MNKKTNPDIKSRQISRIICIISALLISIISIYSLIINIPLILFISIPLLSIFVLGAVLQTKHINKNLSENKPKIINNIKSKKNSINSFPLNNLPAENGNHKNTVENINLQQNIELNNNSDDLEEKINLSCNDISFDEAIHVYFETDHLSCPSKYSYNNYFIAAFESLLNNIPIHKIEITEKKVLRNKEIYYPIDSYCQITKSRKIESLKNFIAIDVETTGLKTGGNDIIEIAAIKFHDLKPVMCFNTYLKPRKPIPIDATLINNITDDMVEDSPKFSQICESLQSFIKDYPLVAHNAPFDMKFLHVSGLNLTEHSKCIYDTLDLSRKKLRDYNDEKFEDYKLSTICEELNIQCNNFHSAKADALACGIIFVDIIKKVYN